MILTKEFIDSHGSDSARALFELTTSLGYTVICPENETGSLKCGFMLQNQYGAIYACPTGETAIKTMMPILRFVSDFDRAGADASTQLSRMDQLEGRIQKIEELLKMPSAVEMQESDASQKAGVDLDDLCMRARAIGTCVQKLNGEIIYCRPRFKIPGSRYKFYFTVDNALDQERRQFRAQYTFTFDELDELARWIAYDEKIFAESNRLYGVS